MSLIHTFLSLTLRCPVPKDAETEVFLTMCYIDELERVEPKGIFNQILPGQRTLLCGQKVFILQGNLNTILLFGFSSW